MNTGHGHVNPRNDGIVVHCGGPILCGECALELAQQKLDEMPTLNATRELIRLARLGLWAEKYGILGLEMYADNDVRAHAGELWYNNSGVKVSEAVQTWAKSALQNLPKDER